MTVTLAKPNKPNKADDTNYVIVRPMSYSPKIGQ